MVNVVSIKEVQMEYTRATFSYQELLSDPLPTGVDPAKLETYLNDDEFFEVFKITREEFLQSPEWKREKLKKDVYLF